MTDDLIEPETGIGEGASFEDVVARRYGRRGAMKLVAGGAVGAVAASAVAKSAAAAGPYAAGELTYDAVALSSADMISLPAGFEHNVIISWGDPVVAGASPLDINNQTGAAQAQQCGYNHDYLAYLPVPYGSNDSDNGLLWINHEYTDSTMMFSTYTSSLAQNEVELAAHGGTVVNVTRQADGSVTYDPSGALNRRITGFTPMTITGPVAGDPRIATSADPSGTSVLGMLNNCGGGVTPWGTILTCEENYDQYFGNFPAMPAGYSKSVIVETNGSTETNGAYPTTSQRKFETNFPRFDLSAEPNEHLRFGWVVEIDPYDTASVPKKRTALGRFKHEAAAGTESTGGRFVSYSGDDQVNQCIYKFVTDGTVDHTSRAANESLLDTGVLYVAVFNADGSGVWKPLEFGSAPLDTATFTNQADVLLRSRKAASLLGGTRMSRPEDVEVNPVTKKVYAVMTGNASGQTNPANPRVGGSSIVGNGIGHVIEITEAGGDNAALTFSWEIFLLCGEPNAAGSVSVDSSPAVLSTTVADNITYWAGYDESKVSPVARVDNVSFDSMGNMFLSTDGQPSALQRDLQGLNDSLFGFPVEGGERGHGKALLCAVKGCEVTGPYFTPDDRTLFVSIQHPGVDIFTWTSPTTPPVQTTATFANPGSSWNPVPGTTPPVPRPGAIAIRRSNKTAIAYGVAAPEVVPEFPLPALAAGTALVIGGLVAFRKHRMSQPTDQDGLSPA